MGIRGLERIIKEHEGIKPSINTQNLNTFSQKRVCIDTSEFIVRSMLKDKTYHVSGILNLLEKCLRNKINLLFVFDGKPPKEKRNILIERSKKKEKAFEKLKLIDEESKNLLDINDLIFKLNELQSRSQSTSPDFNNPSTDAEDQDVEDMNDIKQEIISRINSSNSLIDLACSSTVQSSPDENDNAQFDFENTDELLKSFENKLIELSNEKQKCKKKCHNYNEQHINDIKYLFDLFKIPYIESKCEADIVCTALCKLGIVDAVVSNDMDFIVLGCPIVIRNLNFKTDNVDVYNYENIINNLGLTSNNLVELSLLLGCDYSCRVINIKNKYVYDIYKMFKSLDGLIENIDCLYHYYVNNNHIHTNKHNVTDNVTDNDTDKHNVTDNDTEFLEYLRTESLALDTTININKIKSLFNINMSYNELKLLIVNSIDLSNCFETCKSTLYNISHDNVMYNKIIDYCLNKCTGLNFVLINKKCSTICNKTNNYKYVSYNNDLATQIRNDIKTKYKSPTNTNYNSNRYSTSSNKNYNNKNYNKIHAY
jgi:5'-3' exonuclease